MPTFSGMVHDFIMPTPISSAEIEVDRLTIRQGTWIFEARSCDGFYYEGNYGQRKIDPKRHIRCWLYPGLDGTKVLYSCWHSSEEPSVQGESVFRLVPNPLAPGTVEELPEEWDRATSALKANVPLGSGTPPDLVLVHDRWTGARKNQGALDQAGLYVLFYGNGKIARVGQARVTIGQRLRDYEPNVAGWFGFRWVGAIAVTPDQLDIITPLENNLLATLKPPENTKGVNCSSP